MDDLWISYLYMRAEQSCCVTSELPTATLAAWKETTQGMSLWQKPCGWCFERPLEVEEEGPRIEEGYFYLEISGTGVNKVKNGKSTKTISVMTSSNLHIGPIPGRFCQNYKLTTATVNLVMLSQPLSGMLPPNTATNIPFSKQPNVSLCSYKWLTHFKTKTCCAGAVLFLDLFR